MDAGIGLEQLLLLGRPLAGAASPGRAELGRAAPPGAAASSRSRTVADELLDRLRRVPSSSFRTSASTAAGALRSASVQSETSRCRGRPPVRRVERRLEDRAEAVVVLLRDRVVAMGVALGAADRQAEQRRRDDLDRLGDHVVPRLGLVGRGVGRAVGGHPEEARGDQPVDVRGREVRVGRRDHLVAGELLADQLVPGPIGVEAPGPGSRDTCRRTAGPGRPRCTRRCPPLLAADLAVGGEHEVDPSRSLSVAGQSVRRWPPRDSPPGSAPQRAIPRRQRYGLEISAREIVGDARRSGVAPTASRVPPRGRLKGPLRWRRWRRPVRASPRAAAPRDRRRRSTR